MIRFKKIKALKDGKLRIEYEQKNKDSWDEYTLNCSDEPKDSYGAALQALAGDVIEMCELPEDYLPRITVTGVSFSYGGDEEVMGAVITASMRLNKSNQPLNLNTPHKTETWYSETGSELSLLHPDCVERLQVLTDEAQDYIGGVRKQVDLFVEMEVVK